MNTTRRLDEHLKGIDVNFLDITPFQNKCILAFGYPGLSSTSAVVLQQSKPWLCRVGSSDSAHTLATSQSNHFGFRFEAISQRSPARYHEQKAAQQLGWHREAADLHAASSGRARQAALHPRVNCGEVGEAQRLLPSVELLQSHSSQFSSIRVSD